jgi:hypothetical protein
MTPNVLDDIRRRIGPAPRRIPDEARRYLLTRAPLWVVRMKDDVEEFYRNQELLLREGTVAWAAVVQANGVMYSPGPGDAPATFIYSTAPAIEADPERLAQIAHQLFALKGGQFEHPQEQAYGDMLAKETERAMGIEIPRPIADGLTIRSTTVMIHRKHLPGRVLQGKLIPVLVHPQSNAIMIVPSRTWPEDFAASWQLNYPVEPSVWTSNIVAFSARFAERMEKIQEEHGIRHPWYVRVYVDEPTDGFEPVELGIKFEFEMNPSRHYLSEAHGQRVIIARSQADLFTGYYLDLKFETGIMAESTR